MLPLSAMEKVVSSASTTPMAPSAPVSMVSPWNTGEPASSSTRVPSL